MRIMTNCGNALKLFKVYESESFINLLLEYIDGGTLGSIIDRQEQLKEEDIRLIAGQLLLTLDYMNRQGLIHRDLKPENILIKQIVEGSGSCEIRVADFGFATAISKSKTPAITKWDR